MATGSNTPQKASGGSGGSGDPRPTSVSPGDWTALQESESRYRELFDNMRSGVAVYRALDDGQDFVFVDFNRAGERIDNDTRERLVGKRVTEVRPRVKEFGLLDALRRVWKTGIAEHVPVRHYRDERLEGWYDNFIYRLPCGEVVAIFDDVTQRRRAEAALRESERRFSTIFRTSPLAVAVSRLCDGRFLDVNDAFVQLYGYAREEVVGRTAEELRLWHSGNRDDVLRQLQEQGRPQTVEIQARRKDGEIRDLLASVDLIDLAGERCLLGMLVDLTERRRAEAALRESEAVRRQALESSPDAVFAIDREYRLLFNNQRHQSAHSASGGQPLKVAESVLSPAYSEEVRRYWQSAYDRALQGQPLRLETTWTNREGTLQFFENNLTPLRDGDGTIIGVLVVAHDITERKRLERERSEALARLALVEERERQRLSRELHDQTAQRLVALAVDLKNLETDLAAGRPGAERIKSLRRAVDDLQQQIREIAWDLRAGEPLHSGLDNALREYLEDWSERAQVPADYECRGLEGARLPALLETAVHRVTQEALANVAKHACASHVSVLLEREDSLVRLTVEDDGRGFDVEAAQVPPKGSPRLGLVGMRERVVLAGGTFLIESSPGAGTTILVRIPLPTETKAS